jgi:transposase-like protein
MNLKREYDAAALWILQSDGERIAELEAERDELRQQLAESEKQNAALKEALIGWRQRKFPYTDQRRVIERDFPTEPKP